MTDASTTIVAACRILDGEGLSEAFGHVSARLGDGTFAITPAGPGLVDREEDLLRVGPTGRPVVDDARAVPGEVHIHLSIYEARADVAAVCRFHPPSGMALSTLGSELSPRTAYGAFLGERIALHPVAGLARTAADGAALARTLGSGAAVLIRGFGAVTVGGSVEEATIRAVFLERESAVICAAPTGSPLSADEVRPFGDGDVGRQQIEKAWSYYVQRHRRSGGWKGR